MAVHAASTTEVSVEEVSPKEGLRLFDDRARTLLGMSGEEFVAAYEGGHEWTAEQADAVTELTMLLPFTR